MAASTSLSHIHAINSQEVIEQEHIYKPLVLPVRTIINRINTYLPTHSSNSSNVATTLSIRTGDICYPPYFTLPSLPYQYQLTFLPNLPLILSFSCLPYCSHNHRRIKTAVIHIKYTIPLPSHLLYHPKSIPADALEVQFFQPNSSSPKFSDRLCTSPAHSLTNQIST